MPKLKIKNLPLDDVPLEKDPSTIVELLRWKKLGLTQQILNDWGSIVGGCGTRLLWIPSWPKLRAVCRCVAIAVGPLWRYVRHQQVGEFRLRGGFEKCSSCGWLTGNRAVETAACDECGQFDEVCGACTSVTPSGTRCAACSPRECEPKFYHALHLVANACYDLVDVLEMKGNSRWKRGLITSTTQGRGCLLRLNMVHLVRLMKAWRRVVNNGM